MKITELQSIITDAVNMLSEEVNKNQEVSSIEIEQETEIKIYDNCIELTFTYTNGKTQEINYWLYK